MNRYIYVNYYHDTDAARRQEYLTCINNNLTLPWLTRMFVFLDRDQDGRDLPEHPKIQYQVLGRRMEFRDALEHANANVPPGSIVLILNLDIEILDSLAWAQIHQDFFHQGHDLKTLVCKRHNLCEDGSLSIEEYSWRKGEYCDAYVLQTPILPALMQEDLGFCVGGAPQCDNLMMYLMSQHYHVFSWGSRYKILHRDIARRPNGHTGMITNKATDYRPSKLRDQHIDIPAYQDWDRLLLEKQQPQYLPTWRIHQVEFTVDIPNIGDQT